MTIRTNDQLREKSGSVNSKNPLVSVLYVLMREHLPAGVLEALVRDALKHPDAAFCNGYLAEYAINLADALQSPGGDEDNENEKS